MPRRASSETERHIRHQAPAKPVIDSLFFLISIEVELDSSNFNEYNSPLKKKERIIIIFKDKQETEVNEEFNSIPTGFAGVSRQRSYFRFRSSHSVGDATIHLLGFAQENQSTIAV